MHVIHQLQCEYCSVLQPEVLLCHLHLLLFDHLHSWRTACVCLRTVRVHWSLQSIEVCALSTKKKILGYVV